MVVTLAIALALAGGVGVALAPLLERNRALHSVGLAFAAGTLLSMILLHVMPEAMAHSEHAAIFLLILGVGLIYVWAKGDLDWVKATTANPTAAAARTASESPADEGAAPGSTEEEPLVAKTS